MVRDRLLKKKRVETILRVIFENRKHNQLTLDEVFSQVNERLNKNIRFGNKRELSQIARQIKPILEQEKWPMPISS